MTYVSKKKGTQESKKDIETAIRQVDNEIISELGKRNARVSVSLKRTSFLEDAVSTRRMNSKKLAEKISRSS